jgi:DNA-binding MarR family transcriptional regulator
MIEIQMGSLEERVLRILLKKYPITIDDLQDELGISKGSLDRVIKGFAVRGIISLDILPDKTYIRLLRRDFRFIGRHESQQRPLKHIRQKDRKAKYKPKGSKNDHDDIMYQ